MPAGTAALIVVEAGARLQAIQARGNLICGVNGGLPGFSNLEADGSSRALTPTSAAWVAAAIFGDPEAVEFRPLSTQGALLEHRAARSMCSSVTPPIPSAATHRSGLDFGPTTFYDGQGIISARRSATALEDLNGATHLRQSGTTTELNPTDQFAPARHRIPAGGGDEEIDPTYQAYAEGRSDKVTSDRSR